MLNLITAQQTSDEKCIFLAFAISDVEGRWVCVRVPPVTLEH